MIGKKNPQLFFLQTKVLILLTFLSTAYLPLSAQPVQTAPADSSVAVLSQIRTAMRFMRYYPQEKVYLHFDNTAYYKGETIHFKAYLVRCDTQKATDLSGVLHCELVSPAGDIIMRRKLKVIYGEAAGDFPLDSILTSGFYQVRAFTRYMTSFGSHACFSRIIPVFALPSSPGDYSNPKIALTSNARKDKRTKGKARELETFTSESYEQESIPKEKISASFFPEGGNMVEGLPARVAIMVKGREGQPFQTEGYLKDPNGNLRQTFQTDSEGRAVMDIPEASEGWHVSFNGTGGKLRTFHLPEADRQGCTVIADLIRDDSLTIDLYASKALQGRNMGYVILNGGSVIRCDTITARRYQRISFLRSRLSAGVSQFTLFDSNGKVLAERLFFILGKGMDGVPVKVTRVREQISPCGKVTFELKTQPNSSLSFSAVDAASLAEGPHFDIRTWMLLCSELTGAVRRPWYYLESDDSLHRAASELLMLTQGWRRHEWGMLSGQDYSREMQPVETGLELRGTVMSGKGKRPAAGYELEAVLHNSKGDVVEGRTETDDNGNYIFRIPDLQGEWSLDYSSRKKGKAENVVVGVDRHFSPPLLRMAPEWMRMPVDTNAIIKWNGVDEMDINVTRHGEKERVLDGVTVRARRMWERNTWTDETNARLHSLLFYDCEEDMDRLADIGEFPPSISEWLKTKNEAFGGTSAPAEILLMKKHEEGLNQPDTVKHIEDWFPNGAPVEYTIMPPSPWRIFYEDGLTYKKRPIAWIIDNMFVAVTGFQFYGAHNMPIHLQYCDNYANVITMPETLDELKCVYVSEDSKAIRSHLLCDEIERMRPVVIFAFTHTTYHYQRKGTRHTHFHGYNIPVKFEMEDYSIVPPVKDDFRRTLYWNPGVHTDEEGKATVEFWNNSTCKEMFVSVEGLTLDGKFSSNRY